MAITLGEQMEEALTEWYNDLGKSVPPEELQICRETDAIEHKEYLKAEKAEKAAALAAAGLTEADVPVKKKSATKAAKAITEADVPANKQASAKKQKSLVPKSAK